LNITQAGCIKYLLESVISDSQGEFTKSLSANKTDFKFIPALEHDSEIYDILENHKNRIINRYPNIQDVGNKFKFQKMMQIASEIDPDAFDFIPPTFTFPNDA